MIIFFPGAGFICLFSYFPFLFKAARFTHHRLYWTNYVNERCEILINVDYEQATGQISLNKYSPKSFICLPPTIHTFYQASWAS